MSFLFRKRTNYLVGGSLLVLVYLLITDPNQGALTVAFIGQLVTPVIAVWFSYLGRKALFDYLDMEDLYLKAKETAIGAALIFLSCCIVFYGLLGLFGPSARAADVNTYIPEKAIIYMPAVKQELNTNWSTHPKKLQSPV